MTLEARVLNEIAVESGYKDFDDFFWHVDLTRDLLEEILITYGKAVEANTYQNRLTNLSNIDEQ